MSYSDILVTVIKKPFATLKPAQRNELKFEIDNLVYKAWGDFGHEFIESHVMRAGALSLARSIDNKLVGLGSISEKYILDKKVSYLELTVIDQRYRNQGLSKRLNYLLIKNLLVKSILNGKLSLDVMLITPNINVLESLCNLAFFCYPNPYDYDQKTKKLPIADDETWAMAKELIRLSSFPNRKLNREGLVLENSYSTTPWLIFRKNKIPKSKNQIFNNVAEQYLGYGKEEDKEFVVRVKFTIISIYKYLYSKFLSHFSSQRLW